MPKTLIITEKAAVAKEVAAFLARQQGGRARYESAGYRLPNQDFVGYTNGHLIEMAPIDAYLQPEQVQARPLSYLPVFPPVHQRAPRVRQSAREGADDFGPDVLFKVLEREARDAEILINAGDIGREGQLVMDLLFRALGIDPSSPKVLRAAVTDMHEKALDAAFSKLTPNGADRWRFSGDAAQARQEGDWVLGFNVSRAYQDLLDDRSVAVGRLKAPIMGLVDKREKAIELFEPTAYYTPVITMEDGTELRWKARPGAEGEEGFDEHGRIISAAVAQAIVDRINAGLQGRYTRAGTRRKAKPAPLPFTKTSLEIDASRAFNAPMEEITEALQNLYLKHKLISYIGTDCPYIPETMLLEARNIMAGLSPMFGKVMRGADSSARPASVDDAKIGENEHHAIVPLGTLPENSKALSTLERGIFEMVSSRFAAQFYPDFEYDVTSVEVAFGDDVFGAESGHVVRYGWVDAEGYVPEMDLGDSDLVMAAPVDDEEEQDSEAV